MMPWSRIVPELNEPDFAGPQSSGRKLAYAAAIREALDQALQIDSRVFVMGQGVDSPDGMFGTTLDLHMRHGKARVFDTPLAENGLMGVAVGAALSGMRPIYMHNRPDFLLLAMDQLINHAAKWRSMFASAAHVPLVVWACTGRGWGSAAQHSQALHGLFIHTPGLKLAMPSTAYDAKGLMLSAIADEDPVLILDHRYNFRHIGPVPEEMYRIPFGKGVVRRVGRDATVVAISYMVHEAYQAAEALAAEGIEVEVLDPRTLNPLDEELILKSLQKTGRLIVADTGWKTGGAGAEIAALASEKGFAWLRAPVQRVACPDLSTPAGYSLEKAFYPGKAEIMETLRALIGIEHHRVYFPSHKEHEYGQAISTS
jgi:pyruvate/2-oxoglutarate/acetoin dehydrogenase E1 component